MQVNMQEAEETRQRRSSGALRGQIWIAPDFDDTPEELIDLFYDGEIFHEECAAEDTNLRGGRYAGEYARCGGKPL